VNVLAQFVYLQALDVLTTLAFLSRGVAEANPLVRLVMTWVPSRLGGLLCVKLLAVALAVYCWRKGRRRLLSRANVFFAFLVVWNLVALLVALRAPA
jgi:hypothetical protein